MNNAVVRITKITLYNFKNVVNGTVMLKSSKKRYRSSVLGLYGQNGSGKTAMIDAISVLKYALSGKSIPQKYADYINIDAEVATLEFSFLVRNTIDDTIYNVDYRFSLKKLTETTTSNIDDNAMQISTDEKVVIFDEMLSHSYNTDGKRARMSQIINTCTNDVFVPKAKYRMLTDNADPTDLLVAKKLALATSRSFIFSKDLLDTIRTRCKKECHVFLLNSLVFFGNFELFVIDTRNTGLISLNALPISFRYSDTHMKATGNLALPLNGSKVIPENMYRIADTIINNMNTVLTELIPSLVIDIKPIGPQLLKDGSKGVVIELVSKKNGKEIPLRYESDGIKKIISILQLLIVVYNNDSITVAIDELDSGIFEYLLGELLRIISEKGKGQLIFTSHNLRPLETIDKDFVAFTTVNPSNRYIRLSNVKSNNNLRDFYFRDIILGEQDEVVYEATNNYKIAFAFREAGEIHGA